MRRFLVSVLVTVGLTGLPAGLIAGSSAAPAADPFVRCDAPNAPIRVGVVGCRHEPAPELGGTTAFSYYVPPACAPGRRVRCPALYLLHGFGGDYTSMLGTAARPSGWVAALAHRPAVAPEKSAQPWTESDPAHWVSAPPVGMVLIAPDGRTVPGGDGPGPLYEGFWADWNPRYAKGGAAAKYATAPPRFASYVTDDLVPFVQARFPVGRGRTWRALSGTSLGGYGSYAIGLTHPDAFASIGAVSGIMDILLVRGLDQTSADGSPVGVQPPASVQTLTVPAPAGGSFPLSLGPRQAADFAVATYAFGDPAADGAYYRGRMPVDLARNAHAQRRSVQSVAVRGFSNDTVPHNPADVTSFPDYPVAQAFEDLVFVTNQELNQSFADEGVRQHYELHPGIHSDEYWNPWLREQISAQYAALQHADGSGHPPPSPTTFDYRSTASSFTVWGWQVTVARPTIEFLNLDRVSCSGLRLRGTGVVRITVPAACHTGVAGSRRVRVDLGPAQPTDAPSGADAAPAYGRTVDVRLIPTTAR